MSDGREEREEQEKRREWERQESQRREKAQESDGIVDEEVISEVVSKMTGIPLTRLSKADAARLLG